MDIVINRLNTNVLAPKYAYKTDSGFDLIPTEVIAIYNGTEKLDDNSRDCRYLYSSRENPTEVELHPFERALFKTNQRFIIPDGYEIQVRPKSGITLKQGLFVQLGTVDSDYTGDISIMVYNSNNKTMSVPLHKKLAQGVLVRVEHACFTTIDEDYFNDLIKNKSRKNNGFGHTGL